MGTPGTAGARCRSSGRSTCRQGDAVQIPGRRGGGMTVDGLTAGEVVTVGLSTVLSGEAAAFG